MRSCTSSRAVRNSTGTSLFLRRTSITCQPSRPGSIVEDHRVIALLQCQEQAICAITRQIHTIACLAQPLFQVVAGADVIFNNQDPHSGNSSFSDSIAEVYQLPGSCLMTILSSNCHLRVRVYRPFLIYTNRVVETPPP